MQSQKGTDPYNWYKLLFWGLISIIALRYFLDYVIGGAANADELVLKKEVGEDTWVYATRYDAPATDRNTLRFYISPHIQGSDQEILQKLKGSPVFMITDSDVKDVTIHNTYNGIKVSVKGAVYSYYSRQYIEGDKPRRYRISLSQLDDTGET